MQTCAEKIRFLGVKELANATAGVKDLPVFSEAERRRFLQKTVTEASHLDFETADPSDVAMLVGTAVSSDVSAEPLMDSILKFYAERSFQRHVPLITIVNMATALCTRPNSQRFMDRVFDALELRIGRASDDDVQKVVQLMNTCDGAGRHDLLRGICDHLKEQDLAMWTPWRLVSVLSLLGKLGVADHPLLRKGATALRPSLAEMSPENVVLAASSIATMEACSIQQNFMWAVVDISRKSTNFTKLQREALAKAACLDVKDIVPP